ncbi:MAG: Long-chain-fatty-acid--CoA ligase [Candidatus Thorarchaeota archaeon AB_25]|nr:MAG: Long-chain-fatty-acid--CoA ligase [Candidatus Thorarchaeota archaeon AB_25]
MDELYWQESEVWPENAARTIDYPEEPLFDMLDRSARQSGDLPYTVFMGKSQTFKEVKEHSDRVANFLVSKGIKEGDSVAIFLPNVPHFPAIFFGILKTGAIVVTCNPMYKAGELNYQLNDTESKIVFVLDHPTFTPTAYEAIKGTDVHTVIVCSVKPFLSKVTAVIGGLLGKVPKSPFYEEEKTLFYEDILVEYEPKPPKVNINPRDTAVLIYTGGTTGTPKGAELSHYNLTTNVLQIAEWVYLKEEDVGREGGVRYGDEVYVGAIPWYHSYGLTLSMLSATWFAGQLVAIPDPRAGKPPLSDLLGELEKTKCTVFNCVPALYAGIANHPNVGKYDLSEISICGSGAAPLPPEVAKAFEAVTGAILFEGYGLTETSPVTHINPTNKQYRKFGSIGLPISDTICKIVDIDTGTKEMPVGEVGEIAIHGPQVFSGYWRKPEETENVMREFGGKRFFLTGDVGHMDEHGYTFISDRKKQMINVGGMKAYPREIEDILFTHPKVEMAAAVGIPRDEDPSNEFVKAYIKLKDGESAAPEEFIEWARDKMAGYKRPKEVKIVESLPLSSVGKVLRRVLLEEELKERGK